MIADGVSAELDDLRRIALHGKDVLQQILQRETEATGIPSLKINYNNVFGYYIEVAKAQTGLVPGHWTRKQTTVNAERYISQELKELEHEILSAQERVTALEYQLFTQIKEQVCAQAGRIQKPPPPWPRPTC